MLCCEIGELKIRAVKRFKLNGNVAAFAGTAFTVNAAYVSSIGNDLYILIALLCRSSALRI
jgi:hypothetical protein